jgi:predicted Zn-dependent protease
MKHIPARFSSWLLFLGVVVSCTTVPITGRQQLNLIPSQQLMAMSFQTYDQLLKEANVAADPEKTAMVKRVGNDIRQAVEIYLRQHDQAELLEGYQWEFTLVEDEAANAFALPGGKVVVYTGILPIVENDTGLAVVMGHEIAHAIAQHGGERMSQGLAMQMGGFALSQALKSQPAQTQQLFMAAFGAGAQVGVLLPYSRLQESEADNLGLIFMAMAGYDPRAAIPFWQRMMVQKQGRGEPPEFLSTHPAGQTRIEQIEKLLPEAMQYYRQ